MKKYLGFILTAILAVLAVEVADAFHIAEVTAGGAMLGMTFASFANLRNISEQLANPAGVRRVGVVATQDLREDVIDWPAAVGPTPDVDKLTMEITTAVPLKLGKTVAVITPADNSAFMSFENQGDRYYQSYKYSMGFDIAGLTQEQSVELRKYVNTGAIFFLEYNDGEIRVVGSKLSPIVLKAKGDTGKKGGDKRGYSLTGDNDNYVIEPPFYPESIALPGMTSVEEDEGEGG